jgi:hypothetical protein
MTEISALIKKAKGACLSLCNVRTLGEGAICEPGRGSSPDIRCPCALFLDFPVSRTVRHKFLSFLVFDILL